ncbi:signal peptidase I [Enterococcus sp. LJL98]
MVFLMGYFLITYRIHQITGSSMENTFHDGQWVLVNRKKKLERYQVISFTHPEESNMYIKRIIGLPGDAFILVGNRLVLNIGTETSYQVTYSFTLSKDAVNELIGKNKLPKGKYFVIGDAVAVSKDSRSIGLVDEKQIEGVVSFQ